MKTIKLLFFLVFFSNLTFSQCYTTIKTTASTTIALHTNGSLWGWGYNHTASLGLGLGVDSFNTVFPNTQIGTVNDWSPKYSIKEHVLAIKNNGSLWTWGNNFYGECGNGTTGQQNYVLAPEQIGNDTWQDVATGMHYSLGIQTNGTLWAWGDNSSAQLGNGTTTNSNIPIQIGIDYNWARVFSFDDTSFAIKTDGTLWSWGSASGFMLGRTNGNYSIPGQVGIDNNWATVAPNVFCVMAVKTDGTLWVWGNNGNSNYTAYYGNGQVDANNYENNPTQIGGDTDWKSVSTDQYNFRALKMTGTIWSWGQNMNGVLGDGTTIPKYLPVQIGSDTDWVYLNSYSARVFALKQSNSLYNWGYIFPNYITSPSANGTDCFLGTSSFNTADFIKSAPNPTHDIVKLFFNETVSMKEIILYDALGKVIANLQTNPNRNEVVIDLTPYSEGLYFILVKSDLKYETIKISKN